MHGDIFLKFTQTDVSVTVTTAAISPLGRAEVSIDANEEAVDKTPANRENTTDIQPAFLQRVWEPKRMEKLFVYLNGILVKPESDCVGRRRHGRKPRSPFERRQNCRYRGAIRGRRAG